MEKVDEGWDEVLRCIRSTMNHQEREIWLGLLKERGRSSMENKGN